MEGISCNEPQQQIASSGTPWRTTTAAVAKAPHNSYVRVFSTTAEAAAAARFDNSIR